MTQVLIDFYNKNKDKIELVINGESQSLHNHFYKQVYSRKWVDNIELQKELVTYLHQFRDSIKRSLHQLGIKHNELRHKAELKLKKSKPFLETIVKPSSEIELIIKNRLINVLKNRDDIDYKDLINQIRKECEYSIYGARKIDKLIDTKLDDFIHVIS